MKINVYNDSRAPIRVIIAGYTINDSRLEPDEEHSSAPEKNARIQGIPSAGGVQQMTIIPERHYKVRPLDLLCVWHTKIEAWMPEQTGIDFAPGRRHRACMP